MPRDDSSRMRSFVLILLILCQLCEGFTLSSQQRRSLHLGATDSSDNVDTPALGLLTFDLDDTLFSCQMVVDDGDKALMQALRDLGAVRAHKHSIYQAMRAERRKRAAPITYSNLRMRAIRKVLTTELGIGAVDTEMVINCFETWLTERQEAANRYLFPGTVEMLQAIKTRHPDVCIGAVTNGRGNPLEMSNIREFFDFCVSGEDENVFPDRKPHPGIYLAALEEYQNRTGCEISDDNVWVHVGDDLAKDIGASARQGALPIWVQINERLSDKPPSYSTATKQEAGRYAKLAQYARSNIDVKVETLHDMPIAVERKLLEAARSHQFGVR